MTSMYTSLVYIWLEVLTGRRTVATDQPLQITGIRSLGERSHSKYSNVINEHC